MLNIYCPFCAESRSEEEFHYHGQAHIVRPADPDACSDEEWGSYLYFRYERLKWGAETKPHMVAISTIEQDV